MPSDTRLTGNDDKVPNMRAARYSNLGNDDTTTTEADVVPNLDQIVDLAPITDDRVRPGPTIDRTIGSNFDIIANENASKLWNLEVAIGATRETEPVLADPDPGM